MPPEPTTHPDLGRLAELLGEWRGEGEPRPHLAAVLRRVRATGGTAEP